MQLVLLGSPGAGKGTQGKLLAEHFHIPRIATGDMFRAALEAGTPIGQRAKAYVERGELVPDDLTIEIVRDRLTQPDCARGFILDGFPRTLAQAKALDEMLAAIDRKLDAAVLLSVPQEEAIKRISARLVCEKCGAVFPAGHPRVAAGHCPECRGQLVQRHDDNDETVRRRLEVYRRNTQPVIDYYREKGVLLPVNGNQPVGAVFAEIRDGLQRMVDSQHSTLNGAGTGRHDHP